MDYINLESIWDQYGLDNLQQGLTSLFPDYSISLSDVFAQILTGDIVGALASVLKGCTSGMASQLIGMKNVLIWLVILGIMSALMSHFVEIFDKHQIADISFYFMYLLLTAVLLKCFTQAANVAANTLDNNILVNKMMVPTYMLSIGVATGVTTVGAYYQLLL